jgi:hypothetical protein
VEIANTIAGLRAELDQTTQTYEENMAALEEQGKAQEEAAATTERLTGIVEKYKVSWEIAGVLDKAQSDFADFQTCMTGKGMSLESDITGSVSKMTANINSLISAGLVGEAQNQMKAYTECSSSKIFDMVTDIDASMAKLTADHNAKIAEMKAYAETLTGAERSAVIAQIEALVREYEAKMSGLLSFKQSLMNKMVAIAHEGGVRLDREFSAIAAKITAEMRELEMKMVRKSIWPDMMFGMVDVTEKALSEIEGRFGELHAEKLIGGPFPAHVAPAAGGAGLSISGPLVQIMGSADSQTARLAANMVAEKLKNVLVEASSSQAFATHKRIRL